MHFILFNLYHTSPLLLLLVVLHSSCTSDNSTKSITHTDSLYNADTVLETSDATNETADIKENIQPGETIKQVIETRGILPATLVDFAESLIGTPYKYASTDPRIGFDCSGFITYVFNHFNIMVPRSSVDFTNLGTEVPLTVSKRGDIALFTGTDSTILIVGHMGIIVFNENGKIYFIHSTSGKANGVVITPLERYYEGRFVKVIRIFAQNNEN